MLNMTLLSSLSLSVTVPVANWLPALPVVELNADQVARPAIDVTTPTTKTMRATLVLRSTRRWVGVASCMVSSCVGAAVLARRRPWLAR
jgi:hypothetical protein